VIRYNTSLPYLVRAHIRPNSSILAIVEDMRKQREFKLTDEILIYTVCQFLEPLPHQSLTFNRQPRYPISLDKVPKETFNPSDHNLIYHGPGKKIHEVFPNGPSQEHLHFVAEVRKSGIKRFLPRFIF
jgi:hypothetical protein